MLGGVGLGSGRGASVREKNITILGILENFAGDFPGGFFWTRRRHDRLYLHGPHPRKTMVLKHGRHPLRTMVLQISALTPGYRKNIEVVAEGHFRTLVLRGCRPWFSEDGDHAGTGDHASSGGHFLPQK